MTTIAHALPRALLLTLACTPILAQDRDASAAQALEGMDDDGRIERPELPTDIEHPERWRYTPPGKILPGNPLRRFLVSTFFSPILFSESDVGTGGGVALTDIDFRNQKYRELANIVLTYTSEGQEAYTLNWQRWLNHRELENGGIIREDRSIMSAGVGYSNSLTQRFYGIGSRGSAALESSYSESLSRIGFGLQRTYPDPGDDLILGASINY